MLQGEDDGLWELWPTVRNGRADHLAEQDAVRAQRVQQQHGGRDKPDLRVKRHAESPSGVTRLPNLEMRCGSELPRSGHAWITASRGSCGWPWSGATRC